MVAINTTSLRKEYGDVPVIRDLSFVVESGDIYGFLGPNGAGKTTVMRILTCLLKPTAGSATVAGESIANRDAVTEKIGYLPEEPPLYPELTGLEQLEFWAGFRGMDPEYADDRIELFLDRFDLTEHANKRISSYSKGMQQKVGLIQSILHEPEVLFLDEPTSGLDPNAVRTVQETFREFVSDGSTVFLSTHILPVVDTLADAVGVLHQGELITTGTPEELKNRVTSPEDQTLEDVFIEITEP
ncbi:ABC transporter ATP-binding protein [Halosolutus amylolyticus]|uniref:ABC transporter ATP-binding protein n=1 Tax=Halosolutus amylolyticus TaxID=2932267 RepID=A0ABD5PU34_9EURY|nr:ABC transporter ATP-binding protein [Halosolutus amylolyticus]